MNIPFSTPGRSRSTTDLTLESIGGSGGKMGGKPGGPTPPPFPMGRMKGPPGGGGGGGPPPAPPPGVLLPIWGAPGKLGGGPRPGGWAWLGWWGAMCECGSVEEGLRRCKTKLKDAKRHQNNYSWNL